MVGRASVTRGTEIATRACVALCVAPSPEVGIVARPSLGIRVSNTGGGRRRAVLDLSHAASTIFYRVSLDTDAPGRVHAHGLARHQQAPRRRAVTVRPLLMIDDARAAHIVEVGGVAPVQVRGGHARRYAAIHVAALRARRKVSVNGRLGDV